MPSVSSRPRRRDAVANREKLVAAAETVFAEHGVTGSLEEIARRAEVSIGTLYNHFPNRGSLLDAVYPARIAALAGTAQTALADDDPWRGFRTFLVQVFELQATDRGMNDAMTLRYPDATALAAACDEGFASASQLVERAQASGALRADFQMEDLASLVWSVSRIVSATVDVAPDAWRRFLDLQLDGLRAEGAHPLSAPAMTAEQVATAMRAGT
ncbi:TetR/AcrR family transcriptional regulator [Promicromonospora sp. Populi]|uniref:TetR/AcrR family transcriptional regulator n=1 Tax=Promicromonospora sp. Populi TaxID=3239420 RepID=UPI0034E2D01D